MCGSLDGNLTAYQIKRYVFKLLEALSVMIAPRLQQHKKAVYRSQPGGFLVSVLCLLLLSAFYTSMPQSGLKLHQYRVPRQTLKSSHGKATERPSIMYGSIIYKALTQVSARRLQQRKQAAITSQDASTNQGEHRVK